MTGMPTLELYILISLAQLHRCRLSLVILQAALAELTHSFGEGVHPGHLIMTTIATIAIIATIATIAIIVIIIIIINSITSSYY